MIDPSFTKVALCKLKNSNKYGIYTFSEHTDKLKRRFEQLTGLCSCVHIDFDNVNRVKATFNYGFVNIYFAINVPIKNIFVLQRISLLRFMSFLKYQISITDEMILKNL